VVYYAGSCNEILKISGETIDGKVVLRTIFEVTSSTGLPLVTILMMMKERGMVVDWVDYYLSALDHGMQSSRILSRISSDVVDVYGPEYRDEVLGRLRIFISNQRSAHGL
jgi:hypothetical protein